MNRHFLPGPDQPDQTIVMPQGQAIAGAAVGILVLDVTYPFLPGNVANASSYPFPVQYRILTGSTIPQIMNAEPSLLDMIVEHGRELIKQGAGAIIGACGYFANYQEQAAEILDVPVYLSSLLQVPMMERGLKKGQQVGVICANRPALTDKVLEQCGINPDRLVITGAQDLPEFSNILKSSGRFNSAEVERELVGLAREFTAANPQIGALLLECSDMPPYAWRVQQEVGLPVFDFMSLINWVHFGLVRRPIQGFI